MNRNPNGDQLPVIGWREWVKLPGLDLPRIKAKVDTGARSSSLHAFDVVTFERHGIEFVRFAVQPAQRTDHAIFAEARLLEHRHVRSSSGKRTHRPVILTPIEILGQTWEIELTLANRKQMGFRMLLGREAFRGRALVDAGQSYYGGRPRRKRKHRE